MTLSRRNFLKAAMGTTLASLPLAALLSKNAMAATSPMRAIFVYVPDGCIPSLWHPTGTEFNFTLSPMTASLEAVKQHLVFLQGIDILAAANSHDAVKDILTAGDGVSLDVFLGDYFKSQTLHPSLQLGISAHFQNSTKSVSYIGNNKPLTYEDNPLTAFNRIFGNGGGASQASTAELLAQLQQKSVLDSSLSDLSRLQAALGSTESLRLGLHMESIYELEKRVMATSANACNIDTFNSEGFSVSPTDWYPLTYHKPENFELIGKLQTDIALLALSCDMTRVVSLMWSHPVSPNIIPGSGASISGHDGSHGAAGSRAGDDFVKIKAWYNARFAELIMRLEATPDGTGSLLDNSIIFLTSELGDGNAHNHSNMPFILAGKAGGRLNTGRLMNFNGESHSQVLVSIANAMGVNINTYGKGKAAATGPLPGLLS